MNPAALVAAGGLALWWLWPRSSAAAPLPAFKPDDVPAADDQPSATQLTRAAVEDLAQRVIATHGFRADWRDAVTTAWIESSWRPHVSGDDGASIGLMQTTLRTAADLHENFGYIGAPAPTEDTLRDPAVSMYYGAGYLDWLWTRSAEARADKQFLIRAYNGGLGWQRSERGRTWTAHYWSKWRAARLDLYGSL